MTAMPLNLAENVELIPGYKLVRYLGRGGFGEVWEAIAPGDLAKAIKIAAIDDSDSTLSCRELEGLQKIRSIRHPYLLSIERYEIVDGHLVIVMELADKSLADRFDECLDAGLPGIPRDELIRYMHEAAEVLDILNNQYNLMHLDVKPENLFLSAGHIKVADFGLVQPRGSQLARSAIAISPPYAAPELFDGKVEASADQYSLAVTYQELLTGTRPYPAVDVRGIILQHLKGRPDFSALPPGDRSIVARAVSRESEKRLVGCLDFVKKLESATTFAVPTLLPEKKLEATQTRVAPTVVRGPTPSRGKTPTSSLQSKTRAVGADFVAPADHEGMTSFIPVISRPLTGPLDDPSIAAGGPGGPIDRPETAVFASASLQPVDAGPNNPAPPPARPLHGPDRRILQPALDRPDSVTVALRARASRTQSVGEGVVSLRTGDSAASGVDDRVHNTFIAFLPLEIYAHKLRGFIDALHAEIVSCDDDRTVLRFRAKSWLGFGSRKAIFLEVETFARSLHTGFRVVDAYVWTTDKQMSRRDLSYRAVLLIRCLKAFFMANDDEPLRAKPVEALRAEILR
ncbi:MAG: serine/threonine-protein kinase [Planctomycetia bacterium]